MTKKYKSTTTSGKIKEILDENGETTLEMLLKELNLTFEKIKEPIATLLRNGKIKISGFESYKNKTNQSKNVIEEPRKVLALKYLKFERQYPHTILDIQLQFKKMESSDISGFEDARNYLLKRFEDKFKEYRKWENEILEKMKTCVICISNKRVDEEVKRIIENNLDLETDLSIDEDVKEYLTRYILDEYEDHDRTKLEEFEKNNKEWMKRHNFTHYCFLKFDNFPTTLPPGFPDDLSGYKSVNPDKLEPEEYLNNFWTINTLPKGFIMVENIFVDIIFYINTLEGNIMKNTLIKCLSESNSEKEKIISLKTFGEFLKKLKIIEPSFMEKLDRDQYGIKIKNKNDSQLEEFTSFFLEKITNEFNSWKGGIK